MTRSTSLLSLLVAVIITSSPAGGVRRIAIFASVYLSVCPLAYLKNDMAKLNENFYACYWWPWFGSPLTTVQRCVLLVWWMTSCFHVIAQILILATGQYCSP